MRKLRRRIFWWLFAKEIGIISRDQVDALNKAVKVWDLAADTAQLAGSEEQIAELRFMLYQLRAKVMQMMETK